MSSSDAPSTFLLALASSGGRRRVRAGSFPLIRSGASLNSRFWAPPRTSWDAAVVRAEAGAGGKDAAAPEARQPHASRGGAGKAVSWSSPPLEIGRPV
jgi:hypothetical protein